MYWQTEKTPSRKGKLSVSQVHRCVWMKEKVCTCQ